MERVPHPQSPGIPTPDSSTPFFQADPLLLTPNRRALDTEDDARIPQYTTDKSQPPNRKPRYPFPGLSSFHPQRSRRLFEGYERPNFARITVLSVLCLSAYPALYILTLVARDKSLFTVRLIVALWCSGVGFALGYVLLKIGVQHLEAASE